MAEMITWDALRALAGFRADKGCAISLYVNLDPTVAPTQTDVAARVSALLTQAQRQVDGLRDELGRQPREGLRADLDRIERWFADEFDRGGSRGVVIFADRLDGLFSTHTLPQPVPDQVRLGNELQLAPLLESVGNGEGALVAYVGRERAEVFRFEVGRLVPLAEATDDVPGRHDQGGWSQARYERHIETIVGRHLRRAADMVESCVRKGRGAPIVLIGAEEIRPEFEDLLSRDARGCIIGWAVAEAHATPTELLRAAKPVLERRRAGRETELLGRWREAASREGRASAGWDETLSAASDGRVEMLLVQEGVGRQAYRCPLCGRAGTTNGSCPLDGTALQVHDDGLDLAVHQTLEHGGDVAVIRDQRDLEPVEGIGALLRF